MKPLSVEDGTGSVREMASSGAVIRKVSTDLFYVDWGNVRFSTKLKGMSDLAHDLELYVGRETKRLKK